MSGETSLIMIIIGAALINNVVLSQFLGICSFLGVSSQIKNSAGLGGAVIFVIVILHNLLGYLCGYLIGILFKMDLPRKKAVAIEIGMQNSGLATTLATSSFPDLSMATVPGAIFSVWHNISGAVLAGIFRRMETG